MKISNFDRQNLKEIRQSLETVLAVVAAEHGIKIEVGNIRFSSDTFKVSLEAKTAVGEEINKNYDRNYNKRIPDGTPFQFRGTRYTVSGYNPNGRKFQYYATGPQGGQWKFTTDHIVKGMVG